jgi:hypothetical protein
MMRILSLFAVLALAAADSPIAWTACGTDHFGVTAVTGTVDRCSGCTLK